MRLQIVLVGIFAIGIWVFTSKAQRPPVSVPRSLPDGITIVPPVGQERISAIDQVVAKPWEPPGGQHVIPRFVNGATYPSGTLVGWGPSSVIRATSETASQEAPALVVTEGVGTTTNQFQAGASDPAVVGLYISNVKLSGYDPQRADWAGTGGNMNNNTWANTPFAYDLMRIQASGATIENVEFFGCPGTCLYVTRGTGGATGQKRLFDHEKAFIHNIRFQRALRGIEVHVIDAVLGRIEGWNVRDYGIKLTSGATQVDEAIHIYGVDTTGAPGACIWLPSSAGRCWFGAPLYVENAKYGLLIENNGNLFAGPIYSIVCSDSNISISGSRNIFAMVDIAEVSDNAIGIKLAGQYNRILSGEMALLGTGAVGIQVQSGVNDGKGLYVGSMHIQGASTTEGTAFKTETVLNGCELHLHFQAVGTGLDLNPDGISKLGRGNTIHVWADTSGATAVATPINLPSRWVADNGRNAKRTTNDIRINGRRYWPPADEY